MVRVAKAQEAADAHQVVGKKTEQRLARELGPADRLRFGQPPTLLIQA
jgi:hypothetical protein